MVAGLKLIDYRQSSSRFTIIFRFPVAIKTSKIFDGMHIEMILDEAKTMLEIDAYHNHIVNLQGIAYERSQDMRKLSHVR